MNAIEALVYDGATDAACMVIIRCEIDMKSLIQVAVIAASVGDCKLIRMLVWVNPATGEAPVYAGLFEHWDVFDFLMNRGHYWDLGIVASISPAVYARVGRTRPVGIPENLCKGAICNCYTFGFNQESLDFFCKGTTDPVRDVDLVLPTMPAECHKSAPETLRYLLGKYPNVIWTGYDIRITLAFTRFPSPEVEKEFRAVLITAGHP